MLFSKMSSFAIEDVIGPCWMSKNSRLMIDVTLKLKEK